MAAPPSSFDDHHGTGRYQIRIKGHLHVRWESWFDGLGISHASDGTTVIDVQAVDQAALHGLLRKVLDLGVPLVSVVQVDSKQPPTADAAQQPPKRRRTP